MSVKTKSDRNYCIISLRGASPFPEQKNFFFRFFDFHFLRCIRIYSIRAVKIRSLPSRIVREKANFRRDVPPKKTNFYQGKKMPIQCGIQ